MNDLEQRKRDIKSRIDALREELQPHVQVVENLRSRIIELEGDYRDVLDAIRESEDKARREAEAKKPQPPRKEWVR